MRRIFFLLLALSIAGFAGAQDAPKADPKKADPKDKKVEPKKAESDEEIDVQKTTERIAENAQKASDRLKEKDPGTDTRKLQDEIIKDLDALLKKAQQPPPMNPDMNPMMPPPMGGMPPPQGGMPPPKGSGNSGQKQPNMGGGSSGQQSSGGRRARRESKESGARPMGGMPPGGKDNEPMPAKLDPMGKPANEKPMGSGEPDKFGKGSPKRQNEKLADLYKDVWGQLPDRMRQEMDLYYREQFMPRYGELLRQYYAALAEQRKKGDDK